MLNTDYWWLSLDEARQYKYIDVFHQKPYSDEPNTERDPLSCPMQQSDIRYHLESIDQWRVKFRNINVFRSYALYSSHIKGKEVIGPFLLDIDRFMEQEVGYPPDIDRAIKDTRFLIQKYCSDYKDDDYRIFFTGHKGFHIEIRPEAIGVRSNTDRRQYFEKRRKEVNSHFGDRFVDLCHDHIRLHNSINVWIDSSGKRVYRMKFELTLGELNCLSVYEICDKSEKLANEALNITGN